MNYFKTKLIIITFMLIPKGGIAQTTLGEMMRNEVTPIDSIVKSSVSAWTDAMIFFLTTDGRKHASFNTPEETEAFRDYLNKEFDHNDSFKAFMCNDDDDETYAKYSTGKKRNILPTITMTFTNLSSGKSSVIKKNIRSLNKFLGKSKYNVDHIDVESVQVYLIDDAKKKEGSDIGRFVYYTEHIFATAEYKVSNGVYEMVSQQNDSFYINRGKSYWGQNRDEEALIKKDNVVVILGDVCLTVFYK